MFLKTLVLTLSFLTSIRFNHVNLPVLLQGSRPIYQLPSHLLLGCLYLLLLSLFIATLFIVAQCRYLLL